MIQKNGYAFPTFVEHEYDYFNKNKRCLNAEKFNDVFEFQDPKKRLCADWPPVFFAGRVGQRQFVLLSLNPGKPTNIEIELYKKFGWKKTYLTFFEWFSKHKIGSPYYSRFAVFLSGLLGLKVFPQDRARRFSLLSQNLVNLDLIPYHSTGISLNFQSNTEHKFNLIRPYLRNLKELVKLCNPKVLFINGAVWQYLLNEIGFIKKSRARVNSRLTAHIGECFSIKTVWFDKFMSSQAARTTNIELFQFGQKLREYLDSGKYRHGKKIKDLITPKQRKMDEKQQRFSEFVNDLKKKGIREKEYREAVTKWNKEHP